MTTIQDLLAAELLKRKQLNSQFSMRAMAKLIGISSAQLSKLMQGKKKLTSEVALKIASKLNLEDEHLENILQFLHPELALKRKRSQPPKHIVLSEKNVRALSDWYYLGILSLCRLKNNQASPQWISAQLGISEATAERALRRLVAIGLIQVEGGQLYRSESQVTTSEDVSSAVIRDMHKKNLELAIRKIDSVPIEDREYTYITTAIDPKKIKKAKKLILEFREFLSLELAGSNPTEVFTLGIQLFPLTNNRGNLT